MNIDQSGFYYEVASKRILHNQCSKAVVAAIIGKNKAFHPYTIKMIIKAEEKFFGLLFHALKKSKGLSQPLRKNWQKYPHKICSSSALHHERVPNN